MTLVAMSSSSGRRVPGTAIEIGLVETPATCRELPHDHGVDVSRKKRAAFSHISFWVVASPSTFRHSMTVSA